MPHLQTASLGVWVGSGSRDERADEHGISHLLEHMAFKGTKRRTRAADRRRDRGGRRRPQCGNKLGNHGLFRQRSEDRHAARASTCCPTSWPIPTFDPAELKREQNVIVQEIGASEDNPDDLVFDYLQSTAFPDQPIGRSILGTRETVCSFKDQNLRAYLARNYRGPDMVVAATGAVEHQRRRRRGRAAFRPVQRPGGAGAAAGELRRRHQARGRATWSRFISRSRWKAWPQRHADYFNLQVFTIILGGGMSSRLFQEVREKRGLCYTISAFHAPYADTGMFGIYAGTDAGDVKELMDVAVDEVAADRRRTSPKPRSIAPRRRSRSGC